MIYLRTSLEKSHWIQVPAFRLWRRGSRLGPTGSTASVVFKLHRRLERRNTLSGAPFDGLVQKHAQWSICVFRNCYKVHSLNNDVSYIRLSKLFFGNALQDLVSRVGSDPHLGRVWPARLQWLVKTDTALLDRIPPYSTSAMTFAPADEVQTRERRRSCVLMRIMPRTL